MLFQIFTRPPGRGAYEAWTPKRGARMQVTSQRHADHTVVRLRGELDALSHARIVEELEREVGSEPLLVVLNLHGLRFIDSTGLEAIIRISSSLARGGGRLVVSSPSTFCRTVIERTGLDRILPVVATDDAARAALSSEPGPPGTSGPPASSRMAARADAHPRWSTAES